MHSPPMLPGETIPWPASPGRHRQPRAITQLCGAGDAIYALCNDGSVWQLLAGVWLPEPGIPQRQVGGEE